MFVDFNTCLTDPKQIIRLIILLSCVYITVYQLKGCVQKLMHPPISTLNKLLLNDTLNFPAITICRNPAFKTDLFPKYGLNQSTNVNSVGAFTNFAFANNTLDYFMEETTYSLNETIYAYGYDEVVSNPNVTTFSNYYMQLGCCHTFVTKHPASKLSTAGGIFFYLNHDNNQGDTDVMTDVSKIMSNLGVRIDGFYIFIHDPSEIITDQSQQKKTYSQFVPLESGESVYATLESKEFRMLDRPDEHCIYGDQYSQSECNVNCIHNMLMELHNCSLPWMRGNISYPRCTDSVVIDNITASLKYYMIKYSNSCKCPMSCTLNFYFQKIVKRKSNSQENNSLFSLYYDTNIVTVVQQVVSYNWYSFVADLGGSLGLFLGLSVIGFIEIIEATFSILFVKRCEKIEKKY